MRDFKQLKVWRKSHNLTLQAYKATEAFPKEETYGLTSQIRRASSSIPANIAEGCGMNGNAQFARFLQISMGSATGIGIPYSSRPRPRVDRCHDIQYVKLRSHTDQANVDYIHPKSARNDIGIG